jgi:phosphoglycolate phosphatase-like HAD superfamily hydrolase
MLTQQRFRAVEQQPPVAEPPARLREIDWLIFDLENVLYDATGWWQWMVQQLIRLGLHTDSESLRRVWECDFLVDVQFGRVDFWSQFGRFLQSLGLRRGQIAEMVVSARPRYEHLLQSSRAFPFVARTLQDLKRRRWRLGLAASTALGPPDVAQLLQRLRLTGCFDATLVSLEVGAGGRAGGVLVQLVGQLDTPPHSTAYIGSSPTELAAARIAGALTIGLATPPQSVVHWRIGHFEHLSRVPSFQPLRYAG